MGVMNGLHMMESRFVSVFYSNIFNFYLLLVYCTIRVYEFTLYILCSLPIVATNTNQRTSFITGCNTLNVMRKKEEDKPVCVNCDKSTQKEAPQESVANKSCADAYRAVSKCMDDNNGQVSSCSKLWDEFRDCHDNDKL